VAELGSGSTPRSDYPGSLDTNATLEVDSPSAGRTKVRADVPNDLAAAIVAVQTELGTDPAGTTSDVKTFLQVEHGTDGKHSVALGSNLLFTDATYDIGASGATRPRDLYLSQDAFVGRAVGVGTVSPDNSSSVGMHIYRGDATQTAVANSVLTIENNNHAYITILGGSAHEAGLKIGDDGGAEQGGILYDNSAGSDKWNFYTSNTHRATLGVALGLGTAAPDNPSVAGMHIWRGSAGSVVADGQALITLENAASTKNVIQFLTDGTNPEVGLQVGAPGDNNTAHLLYNITPAHWKFRTGGVDRATLNATSLKMDANCYFDIDRDSDGIVFKAQRGATTMWNFHADIGEPKFALTDATSTARLTVDMSNGDMAAGVVSCNGAIITGTATVSGTLGVTGLMLASTWPSFHVKLNANQSIANTGVTKINWDLEDFDTNNDFDITTNDRFTPTAVGKYLLSCHVLFSNLDDAVTAQLTVYKNGSVHRTVTGGQVLASTTNNSDIALMLTTVVEANGSTDYFEMFVNQNSSTARNIQGGSLHTWWSGCRIG